ncbi:MAG TPA: MBL fold metallo-hydrolase [Dehalococcoidia bacterium]|nr:MBL fold metallo-hydrolase [Dehalococcoidia bacterium]
MSVMFNDEDIRVEKLQLGPYGTNCYIAVCNRTKESLVVDAPGEVDRIIKSLKGTNPKYILLTHDHMDHTGALTALRSELRVPLGAHALDSSQILPAPEISLKDGDTIMLGDISFEVLHTPGHTPDGLCFRSGIHLFSGDSIFPGGPGKTWSPASLKQLIDSLRAKIFVLPDDTQIYPGHGEITNLKKEKEEFAVFESREHNPDLCGDVLWLKS